MRVCSIALSFLVACGCTAAKDEKVKDDKDKDAKTNLAIGDPVPPLVVDAWLNGTGTKAIEPGTIYVVDFWATWCGPCIAAMPGLAEMAREYADKNVVVIPVTTISSRNPLKGIEAYVAKVGKPLGLTFAVCKSGTMDKTWFEAAGAEGYPTTMIVDKQGKLAFMGHPMEVPDVVARLVDGTWKGEASRKEIAAMQDELQAIEEKGEKQPEAALKDLAAFELRYPAKVTQSGVAVMKLLLLMQAKKFDEAKIHTEAILPGTIAAKRTSMLETIMKIWVTKELNPELKHKQLSVTALDALLTAAGKEPSSQLLVYAAEIHFRTGNKPKSIEYLDAAIKAETDPEAKKQIAELGEEFRK